MAVAGMNHFTILTDNLEKTLAFYDEHLGLRPGARPPFTFPGAWLYAEGGNEPILHIVAGIDKQRLVKGVIDHMAFTAHDLSDTLALLASRNIAHTCRRQAQSGVWQVFFFDPNGARVELDFPADEPQQRAGASIG